MSALPLFRSPALARWLFPVAVSLALVSLLTALFFQHVLGFQPCKLCFLQRWPYYLGLPVGLLAYAAGGASTATGRALILVFALIFVVSVVLGVHHAGIEWKFWPGPTDCSGPLADGPMNVLDLRKSLQSTKVVRCDEAGLRVLGLSFAGWNAAVSTVIAALAFAGLRRT